MSDHKDQKRIIVKSRGTYRGIVIMEVSSGFLFYIGTVMHGFALLTEVTAYIDSYYATKLN